MRVRSKFFRVAAEGDSIDGREITAQDIEEMAATYDPRVYGARVWPEHFRGLIPGGPFDALGDVVAAKAEKINDDSALNGKLGLYVQVDALPSMLSLAKSGQKIYHSIEMWRNFAKTGKTYLFGLATTDTPASLGTQVMAFGADSGELLTGAHHEAALEFSETNPATPENMEAQGVGTPSLFSKVKALLGKTKGDADKRFAEQEKAIEEIAQFAAELEKRLGAGDTVARSDFDALKDSHDQLQTQLTELVGRLEQTPGEHYTPRPPATGGDGKFVTDC